MWVGWYLLKWSYGFLSPSISNSVNYIRKYIVESCMYSWGNLYLVKIYFSNKLLDFIFLFGPTPLFTWPLPHMATSVFTEPPIWVAVSPGLCQGGFAQTFVLPPLPPRGILTGICWLCEVWKHLWAEGVPFCPHSGSLTWFSRERSVLGFGGVGGGARKTHATIRGRRDLAMPQEERPCCAWATLGVNARVRLHAGVGAGEESGSGAIDGEEWCSYLLLGFHLIF